MKLSEVRTRFLKFFKSQGHKIISSSSLVPRHDPTLLFTNAGMVQFKDYFLGLREPPSQTAASCQLCMRAGGKHNDLERVGKTARHLTLFEMLGNFSFGDYFKERAIRLAWIFLTNELKIPKSRLYISVHKSDNDAYQIWRKKIKIEKQRIYRFGDEDNFWAMGETGPCGPCSEIFYDQGKEIGCQKASCDVGCVCDRYIEIWNLVFMQYERSQEGTLRPLPKPSVDTGMGLERVVSLLQGVNSAYEIDLFKSLIHVIERLVDCSYGTSKENDVSIRVIADHIRSVSFLISEGVLPSNEGRGYVLRRIIRRAIRHGKKLGQKQPFFFKLVSVLEELMGKTYPKLKEQRPFIEKVIFAEEERFLETLDRGLELLEKEIVSLKEKRKKVLSGEMVYKLYDTFGFPLDLIRVIADEKKCAIDEVGFEKNMEKQRQRSRSQWKGSGEKKQNPLYHALSQKIRTKFVGYETTTSQGKLVAIIQGGKSLTSVSASKHPQTVDLIFDSTPFYGEAGGQVGDIGTIKGKNAKAEIKDTQKPFSHFIVHTGILVKGTIRIGDELDLIVDRRRRYDIKLNHTATHMLHHVLQVQLGDHVRQAGSLVAPDRLRFDFTHFTPLTTIEIKNIENFMNERIRANDPVTATVMSYKEAVDLGAMALFGEKYEDKVRVLQIGDYSTELCGGTHLQGTGEIRLFKIISETAIAAGVRRMEAVTGDGALTYLSHRTETLKEVEETLKATSHNVVERVKGLISKTKDLEREREKLQDRGISEQAKELMLNVKERNGVRVLAAILSVTNDKVLRTYCDILRDQIKSGIVVLGCNLGERAVILAAVTQDLIPRFSAHVIIQKLTPLIGGRGGGKPEFAQGGGPQIQNLSQAIEKAYDL